ncbi:RidA family protein [Microbacterium keratanolyticum]|uniref:RidA family protein n=1 Tax=Microbacterium keratanolyticum TaxID=67574 RepID=UPI0036372F24
MSSTHAEVLARLENAGHRLPNVQPAIAAYTPALVSGALAFTSGQLPLVDGALAATGKVGHAEDAVTPEDARALAETCALNALAALVCAIGDLGRVARVVKVTGFVASQPDFFDHSVVIDGASTLLQAAFGEAGVHTRSAVGVAALPKNSPVEVELVVELNDQSA